MLFRSSDKSGKKSGTASVAETRRLKLEPPFSAGDCGYKAIVTGIFYLALRELYQPESSNPDSKLENPILKKVLMDNKFMKYINVDESANNKVIIKTILEGIRDGKISLTEVLDQLASQLRALSIKSDWLRNQIKETIKSGLWAEQDSGYSKILEIKQIERDIQNELQRLLYEEKVDALSSNFEKRCEELLPRATENVCSSLTETRLNNCAKAVIEGIYSKDAVWLDSYYLQQLTQQLFGSSAILFNDDDVKINSGPKTTHWYVDVPDDAFANELVKLTRNIVIAETFFKPVQNGKDNELERVSENLKRLTDRFDTIVKELGKSFQDFPKKITPGMSSSDITNTMMLVLSDIFENQKYSEMFTNLCSVADQIVGLESKRQNLLGKETEVSKVSSSKQM